MTTPTPETPTSDPFPWEQDGPPIEAIIGPDYSADDAGDPPDARVRDVDGVLRDVVRSDDVVEVDVRCDLDGCFRAGTDHAWNPDAGCPDPATGWEGASADDARFVIDSRTAYGLLDGLTADAVRRDTATRVRETLVDVVRRRAAERRTARPDKVKSSTDVRLEAVGLGDDAESLDALAGAFTAAANEARELAGDLIDDVPRARVSFKVADGRGFELKVCRDQRRELSVDLDAVVDVLVASLLVGSDELALSGNGVIAARAAGIREGIAALRDVLSTSPTFRSTALDSLATRLENVDEDDLAKRLRAAYARVDVGDPRVKLERRPLEEKGGRP